MRILSLILVKIFMLSIVGNSFAAEFNIIAAIDQPKGLPGAIAFQSFKKIVEKRSNGRVNVQVFLDGALGNAREEIEGVQLGTIQITQTANSALTAWVPQMNLFELPFLFRDARHQSAVLESDLALGFRKEMGEKGFHLLGFNTVGLRHMMTTEKSIKSISDLKGLKIRTIGNPVHLDAFEAYGASPLPMAYGELYTALETGVIDGAEAANSNYYAKKFFEVANNWAMVGWLYMVAPMIMNKAYYDKMPKDLQNIINEAAIKVCREGRGVYAKQDIQKLELLKKNNIKITTPNRAPFIKASSVVYDKWAKVVGGRERIDAILNMKY